MISLKELNFTDDELEVVLLAARSHVEDGPSAESMDSYNEDDAGAIVSALENNGDFSDRQMNQMVYALMDAAVYGLFEEDEAKHQTLVGVVKKLSEEAYEDLVKGDYLLKYVKI